MQGAAHRQDQVRIALAQGLEVAADGSRSDEEDSVGEIFGGQQAALAERFLAQFGQPGTAEGLRPILLEQTVVLGAAMDGKAERHLLASSDGLAGRFLGGDGDQGHLAGGGAGGFGFQVGEVDILDHLEHGLGGKRRKVQALLDLGQEPRIESLALQTSQLLLGCVADSHASLLPGTCPTGTLYRRSDICQEGRGASFAGSRTTRMAAMRPSRVSTWTEANTAFAAVGSVTRTAGSRFRRTMRQAT